MTVALEFWVWERYCDELMEGVHREVSLGPKRVEDERKLVKGLVLMPHDGWTDD